MSEDCIYLWDNQTQSSPQAFLYSQLLEEKQLLMNKTNQNTSISSQIDSKRKELITIGMDKGFTHPDTIKISQEVDILVNLFMNVQKSGRKG